MKKKIIEPIYRITEKINNDAIRTKNIQQYKKIFNNDIKLYVQDTVNNNKEISSKILLIDDDNIEYIIEDYYFIKFIIQNITNSRNIKYGIFKINNNNIKLEEEYEKRKHKIQ